MNTKTVCFLIFTIVEAAYSKKYDFMSNGKPSKVKFNIEVSNQSQIAIADSIASKLAPRFEAYSEERKDFVLASREDTADYIFTVRIICSNILSFVEQDSILKRNQQANVSNHPVSRIRHFSGVDRPTGCGDTNLEKASQLIVPVAANVVANVAFNMVTVPFGFVNIVIVTPRNQQSIQPSASRAFVQYAAKIVRNNAQEIWHSDYFEDYNLMSITQETDQLSVLTRNVVLDLDGKMPFFKLESAR